MPVADELLRSETFRKEMPRSAQPSTWQTTHAKKKAAPLRPRRRNAPNVKPAAWETLESTYVFFGASVLYALPHSTNRSAHPDPASAPPSIDRSVAPARYNPAQERAAPMASGGFHDAHLHRARTARKSTKHDTPPRKNENSPATAEGFETGDASGPKIMKNVKLLAMMHERPRRLPSRAEMPLSSAAFLMTNSDSPVRRHCAPNESHGEIIPLFTQRSPTSFPPPSTPRF